MIVRTYFAAGSTVFEILEDGILIRAAFHEVISVAGYNWLLASPEPAVEVGGQFYTPIAATVQDGTSLYKVFEGLRFPVKKAQLIYSNVCSVSSTVDFQVESRG